MKRYKILKKIVLGFLTAQDQYDILIGPEDTVILESDGQTIWAIQDDKREESITEASAIPSWLEKGIIGEIVA